MRTAACVFGPIIAVALECLAPGAAQPPSAPASAPAYADLAGVLEPIRKDHSIPALAALVIQDGRVVAQGATGVRALGASAAVSVDDKFHIGSCTKSMTATLCAILVERGKLRWDSTVREMFPAQASDIRAEYLPVTLEQFLTHRGGLPEDRAPGPAFFQVAALDGEIRAQRVEMVRIALSQPPAAQPGEQMIYSNFGYAIAGAMAEQATGRSWEDLMRQELFEPLGIKSGGFGPPGTPGEDRPSQPRGHRAGARGLVAMKPGPGADNPASLGPCGLVHLTLGDWSRYAQFHMGASQADPGLLRPETLRKLHEDELKQGYAMGWGVGEPAWAKGALLSHAGSNGMWFAVIHLAPGRGVGFLVAVNAANEDAQKACAETLTKLRETYAPDAPQRPSGRR